MYDTGLGCTGACLADSRSQCTLVLDLQTRMTPTPAPAAVPAGTRLRALRLQSVGEPELSYLHGMMHEQINRCTDHTCTDENGFKTFYLKYFVHQLQTVVSLTTQMCWSHIGTYYMT